MVTEPARILLIRPSALGDVCRTVPVLVSLKRRWPEAEIDWLVRDVYAPAVASHPDLHEVSPFARARFEGAWWARAAGLREGGAWLRRLRERGYDLAIDCQGLARSGLFAWATGARARVGFADARELGWLGVNRRHDVGAGIHTVDRMLALVRAEGIPAVPDMRLYTSAADREALDARLGAGARFALLAPTSRWPGKRWPAERFAAVAGALLDEGDVDAVALVGGAGERAQCAPLVELAARDRRIVDLIGRTSVGGLMAAVEASSLVIANDSAALHMAVGFDRPIVALFGPTRTELVGPYRREADVLQHVRPGDRFDHKDERRGREMMVRISVPEVIEKARGALRAIASPAGRAG